MSLDVVVGRTYGPFPVAVTRARCADLLAATGDDSDRWAGSPPPSYAAVPVFVAAPAFFADPDVQPYTGALIHADQGFEWSAPFVFGEDLEVEGTVDSVRARAGMHFVAFTLDIRGEQGTVLTASSTFVMSAASGPQDDVPDEEEPDVGAKGMDDAPSMVPMPAPGAELPRLAKSASRADLVRYAAATGDFNPIHWDHAAARAAGLPGVIVHGLLMGAWAMQAATQPAGGPMPIRTMRLRFRRYLRPARQAAVIATVAGADGDAAKVDVAVESDGSTLMSGSASVAVTAR